MNTDRCTPQRFFDSQYPIKDCLWIENCLDIPFHIEHESTVFVKANNALFRNYKMRWFGLSSATLYLSKKKKNKGYKCLDLKAIAFKLSKFTVEKPKHPYELVLQHHDQAIKFYFKETHDAEAWISKLRDYCVMDDFRSIYTTSYRIYMGSLSKVYIAQEIGTGKTYMSHFYGLHVDKANEGDLQDKIERQVIFNQIKALRSIDHPNVLKLKETHEFKDNIILMTEFIGGSSLLRHILSRDHLPESEAAYILQVLLNTVKFFHQKKIIHRNLKPENILLNPTQNGTEIKITDFGFSCTLDDSDQSTWHVSRNICNKCGTPGYVAPEILSKRLNTTASDIFSLGVILYTCLTGEPLFKGKTPQDIIHKSLELNFLKTSLKWNSLSKYAQDLVVKMTDKDHKKRPTTNEILCHPFLTSVSKKELNSYKYTLGNTETKSDVENRKVSIEDSIFQKAAVSRPSVSGAIQSLIVPFSYLEVGEGGLLEVPEFYFDTQENEPSGISLNTVESNTEEHIIIKIEPIKGSLNNVGDQHPVTPRFNKNVIPQFQSDILETIDEREVSDELGGLFVSKHNDKCYTFPTIRYSPFTQSSIQTNIPEQYKIQTQKEIVFETLDTERGLPDLKKPVRTVLENKNKILGTLNHL